MAILFLISANMMTIKIYFVRILYPISFYHNKISVSAYLVVYN